MDAMLTYFDDNGRFWADRPHRTRTRPLEQAIAAIAAERLARDMHCLLTITDPVSGVTIRRLLLPEGNT